MKYLVSLILSCSLLGPVALSEDKVVAVSVIQLIANPEKFDGKRVGVNGFLVMPENIRPQNEEPVLYLHREDADHWLRSNSLWVEPSGEMRHSRKELSGMYISMVGRFRAGYAGHLVGTAGGITAIEFCNVYSDPARPISQKYRVPPGLKEK